MQKSKKQEEISYIIYLPIDSIGKLWYITYTINR